MSKLHDYLKSQENLITASVDGKTLLDFIDRNAEEYPDYPALNTPANSEYSAWDSISWSDYRAVSKNINFYFYDWLRKVLKKIASLIMQ